MTYKKTNFLIFISFFPVFIFSSNLNFYEIIYTTSIFVIPFLLINYFLVKKNLLNNFFFKFYLSIVIVYGIDNHLGLWSGVIQPNRFTLMDIFGVIYIPALIFLISLMALTYTITSISKNKLYDVFLVFLCVIFIFGIFDQTKSYKKVKTFIKENEKNYHKTKVVIVFDEMSGFTSFESSNYNGSDFNKFGKEFFKKHNFEFYTNIESISPNTGASLSSLLNFSDKSIIRERVLKESSNFFLEYELVENAFFEKYENISVYQNIHIDFCNSINVSKCESYNPYSQTEFLSGFKDTFLTRIISIWKFNGSISSAIIWRSLRSFGAIDSILEPEGHKATFQNLLNSLENDIYSQKYDLIFVHTLVPHRPYGFDSNCNYNGSLSVNNRYFSIKEHVIQHNIERVCVLYYLDNFIKKLKNNNSIDSIDLTLLSDHGARIKKTKDSSLSVIYATKNAETNYKEIKDKSVVQRIFTQQSK
tara:strand:+ start:491 stop:1912 length:1422 start_codon:yes stop_codon:yes gene_type:complete